MSPCFATHRLRRLEALLDRALARDPGLERFPELVAFLQPRSVSRPEDYAIEAFAAAAARGEQDEGDHHGAFMKEVLAWRMGRSRSGTSVSGDFDADAALYCCDMTAAPACSIRSEIGQYSTLMASHDWIGGDMDSRASTAVDGSKIITRECMMADKGTVWTPCD
jgi:hypothetical protein